MPDTPAAVVPSAKRLRTGGTLRSTVDDWMILGGGLTSNAAFAAVPELATAAGPQANDANLVLGLIYGERTDDHILELQFPGVGANDAIYFARGYECSRVIDPKGKFTGEEWAHQLKWEAAITLSTDVAVAGSALVQIATAAGAGATVRYADNINVTNNRGYPPSDVVVSQSATPDNNRASLAWDLRAARRYLIYVAVTGGGTATHMAVLGRWCSK